MGRSSNNHHHENGNSGRGRGRGRNGGGGRGERKGWGGPAQSSGQQWVNHSGDQMGHDGGPVGPPQQRNGGQMGGHGGGPYYRPQQQQQNGVQGVGPTRGQSIGVNGSGGYGSSGRGGGGGEVWGGRPGLHTQAQSHTLLPDIESLQISGKKPPLARPETTQNRFVPINRPDKGGTDADWKVGLFANHFLVSFKPEDTIFHYHISINPQMSRGPQRTRNFMPRMDHGLILNKLFSDNRTQVPVQKTAYDGEKFIFSKVPLPMGRFGGEDKENHLSPVFTITLVNELSYAKLKNYISGNHRDDPRDILQGMDLVMKENPSSQKISVGRSFYSKQFRPADDLKCGVAAFRGFQQSLKPTSQGLALCLDHEAMPFCKHISVIDFLKENVRGFHEANDVLNLKRDVEKSLRGLNVCVTHRNTKKRFLVAGLSKKVARDISFTLEDHEPPRETGLVEFFWERYNKKILYEDIHCLDLGRCNYVPLELCTMGEGQIYPREKLPRDKDLLKKLKDISMPRPKERKSIISEMLQAKDGPCGNTVRNFGIAVDKNMTRVVGRVLAPPTLKLRTPAGYPQHISVDRERCQWSLNGKSVLEGKPLKRWAFIDFTVFDRRRQNSGPFIQKLINKCSEVGIPMEQPAVCRFTDMDALSTAADTQEYLNGVVKEADRKCNGRLQLFVCIVCEKYDAKKYLKWVSETKIGIMTQCCSVKHASNPNKRDNDSYISNLALKINAKIGGSNAELVERLPGFPGEEHVMLIGADVNHPGPRNRTCPSFAGVVATANWPAVSRYIVRLSAQDNRNETIVNFGATCLDLVNTYTRLNKVKPQKIVVFRDGVGEGQFDKVLNEELRDMKRAIYQDDYRPTITLIVVQKRHLTRLFVENERDGGKSGNVPPGTVVDTEIVHPFHFDFYLCSQHGMIGTSKAAHYNVLWDEHNFTSDQIQRLVYHLCFTSPRCTKPTSLVPPVFYADHVAFRGRMYHDAAMEFQPQSAALSSSSSAALLNEGFYKVHQDLKDEFFCV